MIYVGDCTEVLKTLQENSVDCCVTSPPYYRMRNYEEAGQIGMEETPEEYIVKLVAIFEEVKRVLKPEGTLWINIGDSYSGSGKGSANYPDSAKGMQSSNKGVYGQKIPRTRSNGDTKNKDLIGIPWMLAFALRAAGWYLRQDIIWAKPDPMPESVKDRCTRSHEYIFLLSKSSKYYFDHEAIQEPAKYAGTAPYAPAGSFEGKRKHAHEKFKHISQSFRAIKDFRNKRDVWTVGVSRYRGAHFATFPPNLIEPCILAGAPEGGIVLDPFFGAGTTGVVAVRNGRDYIGIELNPRYAEIAENRIQEEQSNGLNKHI